MADQEGKQKTATNVCHGKGNVDENRKPDSSGNASIDPPLTGSFPFGDFCRGQQVQCTNIREYAKVLQNWLWQYRMLQSFGMFHSQMLASAQHNMTFQQNFTSTPTHIHSFGTTNVQRPNGHASFPSPVDGTQYKIPLLWRRIVAEILDFILLFYLKIIVTVAVLRKLGYTNDDFLDIDVQIPLDYEKMFSLTSELIALEVINRLCITLVEAMCLKQGYAGTLGGATPGKKIMKLRVIAFDEIHETRDRYVSITGARDPGFVNALVRSVIKNFSMAFFFPASFTVFFFRYNRAAYDVLAQTIVVEAEGRQP